MGVGGRREDALEIEKGCAWKIESGSDWECFESESGCEGQSGLTGTGGPFWFGWVQVRLWMRLCVRLCVRLLMRDLLYFSYANLSLSFSAACPFVQSRAAPQDPPAPTIGPCITQSPSRLAQCHKYLGGNLFYDFPLYGRSIYASEGRKEEIINWRGNQQANKRKMDISNHTGLPQYRYSSAVELERSPTPIPRL